MIFIPAIAAALAPIVSGALAAAAVAAPVVKTAAVAAGVGAAVGGAVCGIGGVASGIHQHGGLNQEIAAESANRAAECAVEGALIGGVLAPALPLAGTIIAPAFAPVVSVVDDVARPVIQFVDDVAKPAFGPVDDAAKSVGGAISAPVRLARNLRHARNYQSLPKGTGNSGYVYVMDDVSTPGRYKIGKTIQPEARLKQVQSDLNKVGGGELKYRCIIKTDNMKAMEDTLHYANKSRNLPDFGVGTEWFALTAAQVAAACSH